MPTQQSKTPATRTEGIDPSCQLAILDHRHLCYDRDGELVSGDKACFANARREALRETYVHAASVRRAKVNGRVRWLPVCALCGTLGLGQDSEGDAAAVAEFHSELEAGRPGPLNPEAA